jgi:hypothetical protein
MQNILETWKYTQRVGWKIGKEETTWKSTHNLKNTIKRDLKEKGDVDRIHLTQDWDWRWALMNME